MPELARPQSKSDAHDVTDWSTDDYMLCKTYCVTVLYTVLITTSIFEELF